MNRVLKLLNQVDHILFGVKGILGVCKLVDMMIRKRDFDQYLYSALVLVVFLNHIDKTVTSSVSDVVDDEESISRFQHYLKINTAHPNPKYYEAADFIISQAKSLSLESQSIEFVQGKPLVLLKWPGKDSTLQSILLNSHTDVVPVEDTKWVHPPFDARVQNGNVYARGSQDMKCVGLQYLEAIRKLKHSGFKPLRDVYLSFVPDEEIGGHDGAAKFANSEVFDKMNVGIVLDEGLPSINDKYRVFYAERSPWWLLIKSTGAPGHGAKLYDNTALENLFKSIESIRRFRGAQFDLVKAGLMAEGEVVSVNMVALKAGTPSPTGFVMNLQPSEAEAAFDIRVPPTADQASLERRIAEEWAPTSRNMTFELGQFKQKVSAYDKFGQPVLTATDESNHWWSLLEGAITEANGKLENPEIFPASTDARYFRDRGLPAIGFSPMANTPILLHDHNEFLNKDEYLRGIEIYESIIKAYASFDDTKDSSKDEL
ncbi:N-acyl-aliphatic-L-amino acid amidohydrolase [Heracleum sosnowskyi]|uniref:N-acyl-aliphatic-L-amino acid amidohydrolase n=1 Tax=Heracleum sosnowskyi TaxID=360622 RepID=A0AAD8M6B8_9APIA|nr:N-acyl-aliphatic-L-amino acid amidohydrolase [Heracleum sosnowskyi]